MQQNAALFCMCGKKGCIVDVKNRDLPSSMWWKRSEKSTVVIQKCVDDDASVVLTLPEWTQISYGRYCQIDFRRSHSVKQRWKPFWDVSLNVWNTMIKCPGKNHTGEFWIMSPVAKVRKMARISKIPLFKYFRWN